MLRGVPTSSAPTLVNPLLDLGARLVIGHRGASAQAPENTLAAFRQALAAGADALELDVHATADGEVVVMHDARVARTTDGAGAIGAMTLAELRRLDAGARFTPDGGRSFPYRGRGVVVPTLGDVLDAFPGVPLVVELKTALAAAGTRAALERHGAAGRCVVASFDAAALAPFRGGPFALGASPRETARLLAATLAGGRPAAAGYAALCTPRRWRGLPLPVAGFVRALAPAGRAVHVWTVDDPETALSLWRSGVQGIITNDPAAMVRARAALGPVR